MRAGGKYIVKKNGEIERVEHTQPAITEVEEPILAEEITIDNEEVTEDAIHE